MQVIRDWQSLVAGGSWSRFGDGIWSVQGQAAGSAYLPEVASVRPELEARAGGTRHQDGGGSGEFGGALRLHRFAGPRGVWLGGSGGRAWNGESWSTELSAEAGGWARVGDGILALTLAGWRIGSELRYGEVEGVWRIDRGALELSAWAGLRTWFRPADASGSGWIGGSAAWWLGDRLAITAGGGSYPADFAQGLPEGAYGSVGLRVATGRITPARRVVDRLDLLTMPARRGPSALSLENAGDGRFVLALRGVTAGTVEIMGDFTGWNVVPLDGAGDGRWTVSLPIAPGIYRMNYRTDGGPWRVPEGMVSSQDDFGGDAGILVVE